MQERRRVKLALSMLCEHPRRKTGLTTLFHEFLSRAVRLFPEIDWLLFAGPTQQWDVHHENVALVRQFQANDQIVPRLWADHFRVPAVARAWGADVLLTLGFVPVRKCLPIAMQIFSLQHLDRQNRVGLARELYRKWVMHGWPTADLIITNSKSAATQILGIYPSLRDVIVQSYEGLQHDRFNPVSVPEETNRLHDQFGISPGYFLWVSNLYPYKQLHLLLAGYAQLDSNLRRRHPLVIVGGDWEGTLQSAQAEIRALGIGENVRFLDWVGDEWLAPLYRHAQAFCLASREETFGRCVIEAMACGVPCVVNDIPVMREVTDGHAVLVDYRRRDEVARALKKTAEDEGLIRSLRSEGMRHAERFTFEKLTIERITAIQKLIIARQRR
jgi:glycosyltransferase involved in cell wall biosynthesis